MTDNKVFGYQPYWTASSSYFEKVPTSKLSTIASFSVSIDGSGNVSPPETSNWPPTKLLTLGQKVPIQLTATCMGSKANAFLSAGETAWKNASRQLNALILQYKFAGLGLDIEGMSINKQNTAAYRDAITLMVKQLPAEHSASSLAVQGNGVKELHLDQLVTTLDTLFLMAYDFHWSTAPNAGPVAPLPTSNLNSTYNAGSLLDNLIEIVGEENKKKIVFGMPLYGYDWPTETDQKGAKTTGRATVRTYGQTLSFLKSHSNTPQWDESTQSPWLAYQEDNQWRQFWYEDLRSLKAKIAFAKSRDVQSTGIWAMGFESAAIGTNDDFWSLI